MDPISQKPTVIPPRREISCCKATLIAVGIIFLVGGMIATSYLFAAQRGNQPYYCLLSVPVGCALLMLGCPYPTKDISSSPKAPPTTTTLAEPTAHLILPQAPPVAALPNTATVSTDKTSIAKLQTEQEILSALQKHSRDTTRYRLFSIGNTTTRFAPATICKTLHDLFYQEQENGTYTLRDHRGQGHVLVLHCPWPISYEPLADILCTLKPQKLILIGTYITQGRLDKELSENKEWQWLAPTRKANASQPKEAQTQVLQIPVRSVTEALTHHPGINPTTGRQWPAIYVMTPNEAQRQMRLDLSNRPVNGI